MWVPVKDTKLVPNAIVPGIFKATGAQMMVGRINITTESETGTQIGKTIINQAFYYNGNKSMTLFTEKYAFSGFEALICEPI